MSGLCDSNASPSGWEVQIPPLRNAEELSYEEWDGRDDPRQRFGVYRLCDGDLQLIATCESEKAVGVTLCTLGREGELDECPVGVLDRMGEVGQKWIFRPWLPSPKNVSDAGRMLGAARKQ